MRRLLATVVLSALLAACGGSGDGDPVDAVATQVERVATLLEQGEDCRALEAAATLQAMAEQDAALDEPARDAAALWADQARQHLSCEAPASSEPPEGQDRDPGDAGNVDREDDGEEDDGEEDDGEEGEGRGNGTKGRDEGRGNGPPDERDDKDDD